MLVPMKDILMRAKEGCYGVAMSNVWSEISVRAAFDAAREMNAPIILGVAEIHNIPATSWFVREYAKRYPDVEAVLHLDHGSSFEIAIQALHEGFTSLMVDRSLLPFEDNVREVSEITKIAHAAGLSVEAELGHVGQGYEYEKTRDNTLTRKEEAVEFVQRTGVDALAVAVGTSHGVYKGEPHLDFKLLAELSRLVDVPLVLHGGSGTGDDNLAKAVKTGIQKVNLYTDLSNAGLSEMWRYLGFDPKALKRDEPPVILGNPSPYMCDLEKALHLGYKNLLIHYIKLFESAGKAFPTSFQNTAPNT